MREFLNVAIRLVNDYSTTQYKRMSRPTYKYIEKGLTGNTPCGQTTDISYQYCPADQTITIGLEALWTLYQKFGAAGAVVALAHEWGHHVQNSVHVPAPVTDQQTIVHENQADCVAGAWTRNADHVKILEYPKDIVNAGALLVAIGDIEGPGRTHGTATERLASFSRGFAQGMAGCSAFYPSTPLLTPG